MTPEVVIQKAKPTVKALMALNRKERRRLGKLNGITIPGSTVPVVNTDKR